MPECLICNKKLGLITESHTQTAHKITCKQYAKRFGLKKGELNPNHSKKMKGKGNPRFGVVPTKETREKIRSRHKGSGRFKGEGNPMFGKTHTPEIRKKISDMHKGKFKGEKNSFYGRKHSEETKKKISEMRIMKGHSKGEKNPTYGKGDTEKTKKKISKLKKEFFRKHPEKHVNALIAKNYKNQRNKKGGYISKRQIEIYEIIKGQIPEAVLNCPTKTEKNLYFADIGIPSMKLDIEYDSTYWHKNQSKDNIRDENIRKTGWDTFRIKEENIKHLRSKEKLSHYIVKLINNLKNSNEGFEGVIANAN